MDEYPLVARPVRRPLRLLLDLALIGLLYVEVVLIALLVFDIRDCRRLMREKRDDDGPGIA